ncbi:MAG: hypothetical protein IKS22_04000 [Bacteroidales bacterium]|nr:hypothetical protein [Bacteroidales bacterium]
METQKAKVLRARLMDSPEDFRKLGINPDKVEAWEDGRRTRTEDVGSEIWYFDGTMEDGTKYMVGFRPKSPDGMGKSVDSPHVNVFRDYYESNIYGIMNTRGARTVFLQGEKHLMELDNPERVARELFDFVDQCHEGYYKEITEPTGDEDPGFLLRTMMKAAAKIKGVKE